MADLYFLSDLGSSIWKGGVAYNRVSPTPVLHAPVGSIGPSDVTAIEDYTFFYADSQGDYTMQSDRVAVANNTSAYNTDGPTANAKSWVTIYDYAVPVAGVIRMWQEGGGACRLYINGTYQGGLTASGLYNAVSGNVGVGDQVTVYNNATYSPQTPITRIYPFIYNGGA